MLQYLNYRIINEREAERITSSKYYNVNISEGSILEYDPIFSEALDVSFHDHPAAQDRVGEGIIDSGVLEHHITNYLFSNNNMSVIGQPLVYH